MHRTPCFVLLCHSSFIAYRSITSFGGRTPDSWGSPCPLCGPCSGTRNSHRNNAGNGSRSCHCNGSRSGLMTGPRACARSSNRHGACSRCCICTLSRTRPSYCNSRRSCRRNGPRACARTRLCNSTRSYCRNGARSGPCLGPTNSPRPCPASNTLTRRGGHSARPCRLLSG